jgi:uncharacterized alpha-E superfamily protein
LSRLLSSHAESLFLLARRIERAESLARLIEVNATLQCPQESASPQDAAGPHWAWIVSLNSDEAAFYEHYSRATPRAIGKFYICCKESPRSIHTSIRAARESVSSLRSVISVETSRHLAQFHEWLRCLDDDSLSLEALPQTCDAVKRYCYALEGLIEGSFYRDEAWAFFSLGRHIERAEQTSKLLDVGFVQHAAGAVQPDPDYDFRLWTTLLRSTSAYGPFRRRHPTGLDPAAAARFLVFDPKLPRSLASCIGEIQRFVNQLRVSFRLRAAASAARQIDAVIEGLDDAKRDASFPARLHEFNDWTQKRLEAVTAELEDTFFGQPKRPASVAENRTSV